MKFSEIGRLLFDEFSKEMERDGFRSRWSHRDVFRNEEWGRSGFHLYYYNSPGALSVSGELMIRIAEVHAILDPFMTDREPKFIKELPTLSKEQAQHLRSMENRPWLRSEDDVPAAVKELARVMREVAQPFYDRYHTVPEAYALLKSDDRYNQAYSLLTYKRGMTLRAMAKILGKYEDIPLIAEEYRIRIVKASEEQELPMFEALVASLN